MKITLKKILIIFNILLFLFPLNILAFDFKINSDKVIFINLTEDKVMYQKNQDEKTYIASLTKMMTLLVSIENIDDLNKKVQIKQSDLDELPYYLMTSGLDINTDYTYKELLYGLILPSGADCGVALARLTFGSTEKFIKAMNEKAASLGMKNTKYANVHGLDDKNNYSTAYDQSLLLRYGIKNEVFYDVITKMKYKDLTHTIRDYIKGYNFDMPYLLGGKTGTETKAGYCLASIAKQDNMEYLLVTLNAEQNGPLHFKDAKNLYDYYINNYGYHTLIGEFDTLVELDTYNLKQEKIIKDSSSMYKYYLYNKYDKDKIKYEYDGIKTITTKNKLNDKLGVLNVYYDEELLDSIDIILDVKPEFSLYKYLQNNPIYIFGFIGLIGLLTLFIFIKIKVMKRRKKRK